MKPAKFEEREYEAPLYHQLAGASRNVWSPGQVFEGHIGFDHAVFADDPRLFRIHGFRSILPGAVLPRYNWPVTWFVRRSRDRLPGFALNLFLQAKRPQWTRTPSKALKDRGFRGVTWSFRIEAEQQSALELVAEKISKRSLVTYAAPTFHEHKQLFRHTRTGTIVENSTFPSVLSLRGHKTWYYSRPGAIGVANPDFAEINESTLQDRIAELLRTDDGERWNWRANLKQLASDLRNALMDESLTESSRRALFFDLVRATENDLRDIEERELISAYSTVVSFCEAYRVDWYVLGNA